MKRIYIVLLFSVLCALGSWAQNDGNIRVNPNETEVDMDNPTFVPMVKVGKVLDKGDSIQYVELNKVYVYPQLTFENERQRMEYNRLVYNVKKVLPIAKEVNKIIVETYEYLQTLPDKKSRDEHMKLVEADIKREYTPRMKKLTYAQGKLLIIHVGYAFILLYHGCVLSYSYLLKITNQKENESASNPLCNMEHPILYLLPVYKALPCFC